MGAVGGELRLRLPDCITQERRHSQPPNEDFSRDYTTFDYGKSTLYVPDSCFIQIFSFSRLNKTDIYTISHVSLIRHLNGIPKK